MQNSEKEFLISFGWDEFFEKQIPLDSIYFPRRILGEERQLYRIQTSQDVVGLAVLTGKFQFNCGSRLDYPSVGDWVLVEYLPGSDRALIHQVLDRKSIIHRKQIGSGSDAQTLAANVDYIFITSSVNDDLNIRRIERYLAMAFESGATPVVLLTKADVIADQVSEVLAKVQSAFPGVKVHALSQDHFEKAGFFEDYLNHGKTAVVVGSSGVGKSTLINYLIDAQNSAQKIKTQDIRDDDSKGRHTTTSRNMYVSRFGGLVIDTPGMRELQLADHGEGVRHHFSDIEDLFQRCRFNDCRHQTEPGCAVIAAFESGELADERWKNYQKLQAEVRYSLRRQDKQLTTLEKKQWKKKTMEGKQRGRLKRQY